MSFSDLDHASEYVENALLERAAYVRGYWLLFESFRKLHTQAVLKATYEIFEAVLGTEVGKRLWRYAEQIKYSAGSFITREGRFNHTLYLLQRGRVTTFRASDNDGTTTGGSGIIQRIHTMSRGAFVNEECLFMDVPVQHSTVADEDCVVWAISRESMKQLEAHEPHLAAAILRNVLRMSSMVRNRLEREVSAIDHGLHTSDREQSSRGGGDGIVSKTLGSRVLAEIRDMHEHHVANVVDIEIEGSASRVSDAGLHHAHHFHHMNVQVVPASPKKTKNKKNKKNEKNEKDSSETSSFSLSVAPRSPRARAGSPMSMAPEWTSIRPHLSAAQRQDAIECFLFHSVLGDHSHFKTKEGDNLHRGNSSSSHTAHDIIHSATKRRRGSSNYDGGAAMMAAIIAEEDEIGGGSGGSSSGESGVPTAFTAAAVSGRGRKLSALSPTDSPTDSSTDSSMDYMSLSSSSSKGETKGETTLEAVKVKGRRISLEELQRAVMDLGLFPTTNEIIQMHETLGPNAMSRVSKSSVKFEDGADVEEFLNMVMVLSVKEMGRTTIEQLHKLFVQHADEEERLWRDDLSQLMQTLNHPEDEVELEFLMKEWDLESRGYLVFDAFVSIVGHVLKSEELDEQLEKDFLIFCGETEVEHPSLQQMHSAITAADIVRVAALRKVLVDHQLAEEMIFDADESGHGKLSLDDLIACIETVGADEAFNEDGVVATDGGESGMYSSLRGGGGSVGGSDVVSENGSISAESRRADDTTAAESRHFLAEQKMNRMRSSPPTSPVSSDRIPPMIAPLLRGTTKSDDGSKEADTRSVSSEPM
jgi:CRP-like cAMP-binding protein/Ca2+-binding EF-hand superfamily protein